MATAARGVRGDRSRSRVQPARSQAAQDARPVAARERQQIAEPGSERQDDERLHGYTQRHPLLLRGDQIEIARDIGVGRHR